MALQVPQDGITLFGFVTLILSIFIHFETVTENL
jgi:hypothetical protein